MGDVQIPFAVLYFLNDDEQCWCVGVYRQEASGFHTVGIYLTIKLEKKKKGKKSKTAVLLVQIL